MPQSGDAFQVGQEPLEDVEREAALSGPFDSSEVNALTAGVPSAEKDVPVIATATEVGEVGKKAETTGDVSSDMLASGSSRVSPSRPLFSSSFQGGAPFSSILPSSSLSALRNLIDSEHTRAAGDKSQLKVKAEEDLD